METIDKMDALMQHLHQGTREFTVRGELQGRLNQWADYSGTDRRPTANKHISNGIAAGLVSLGAALAGAASGAGGAAGAGYAAAYDENTPLTFNEGILQHLAPEYHDGLRVFLKLVESYDVTAHQTSITFTKKR